MAILIEAITTTLALDKLEEGKAILRAQTAKVPIRINKNIAEPLMHKGLIQRREDSFFELTSRGQKAKLTLHNWAIDLDTYMAHRSNLSLYITHFLQRRKPLFKIMISTCLCCGEEKQKLEHIVDFTKTEGSYCEQCLQTLGYEEAKLAMLNREREAQEAWLLARKS